MISQLILRLLFFATQGAVFAKAANATAFVDPRPTAYYTTISLIHPSDIVLTRIITSTAWLGTATYWSTEPCVSIIEVVPGVTGWVLITSYERASSPYPSHYTHTEWATSWTTLPETKTTTLSTCSATLVVSSVLAATTTLLTTGTHINFVAYTTVDGVCRYMTEWVTVGIPPPLPTTPALPPGDGTVYTTTQPYTVTWTSYVSQFTIPTTTITLTRCINPTVTVLFPTTVTVTTWPAGTITITSEFRCGLRGLLVPSRQRGIVGPIFRSAGPPVPGGWPIPPGNPFELIPPGYESRRTDVPKTTATYTMTERKVVATVTEAMETPSRVSRTVCAQTNIDVSRL